MAEEGYKYKSVYEMSGKPNARALGSAARANVRTGDLMVRWYAHTKAALDRYKGEHGRAGSAASGARASAATLSGLAKKLFSAYIRYAVAQDKHGLASAAAPRKANEFSQVQVEDEEEGWLGTYKVTRVVKGGLSVGEEREINAIVGENVDLAAQYGLVQSGNNMGPNINIDTAKAKIAAEEADGSVTENVGAFAGGRRRKARKTRKAKGKSRKGKGKGKGRKGTRRH